jgi:signal transduction histidine kinase
MTEKDDAKSVAGMVALPEYSSSKYMSASAGSSVPGSGVSLPLPLRQLQRYVVVFHIVFLGGLAVCLFLRWRAVAEGLHWQDALLTGVVLAQAALYVRFLVSPPKQPLTWAWWWAYFAASFALWLVAWRLEPRLEWVMGAYLGQMFAILPPRYSLPGSAAVFIAWISFRLGWEGLLRLSAWHWFLSLSAVGAWTAFGLFLHRVLATSSERARLIQELETAKQALELSRQREAELAVLRERERLARELHDSLGHALVTLTVQLEAVQRLLGTDSARAGALLEEMKKLTRSSMESLRRSLANLRTPGLGDRPLSEALRQLCSEISQRTGLRIESELAPGADRLPPAVAEALWRVAQEGLTNVERHAQARSVRLSLSVLASEVLLVVADDGLGLPAEAEGKPGHYGLRGLRERVEGLGGGFSLGAVPTGGAVIQARIPSLA